MAHGNDDVLGRLLQEVFSDPDGVKRLLEHLLGQAMAAAVGFTREGRREMARKVSYKVQKELLADLAVVFEPQDRSECLRRGEELACQWEGRYPAVARMLRAGLEDCLTVLSFPAHHRRRLQSTNMMENLMRRLRKRSRVVGAQLIEVHEAWSVEPHGYFNMENVNLEAVPARHPAVT